MHHQRRLKPESNVSDRFFNRNWRHSIGIAWSTILIYLPFVIVSAVNCLILVDNSYTKYLPFIRVHRELLHLNSIWASTVSPNRITMEIITGHLIMWHWSILFLLTWFDSSACFSTTFNISTIGDYSIKIQFNSTLQCGEQLTEIKYLNLTFLT